MGSWTSNHTGATPANLAWSSLDQRRQNHTELTGGDWSQLDQNPIRVPPARGKMGVLGPKSQSPNLFPPFPGPAAHGYQRMFTLDSESHKSTPDPSFCLQRGKVCLVPFYRQGNRGLEWLGDLSKVIWLETVTKHYPGVSPAPPPTSTTPPPHVGQVGVALQYQFSKYFFLRTVQIATWLPAL